MHFRTSVDRVLAWWLVGVLAAILIALASLALINRLVYGPEGQVRAYFAAVREGDGSKALGILGAQVPEASVAMLDGDALQASLTGMKHLSAEAVTVTDGGERATVTVTYTLEGQEGSTDFHLHKVGSHWGVFDRWQIDASELPTVEVTSNSVEAATLNNTKVSVEGGAREFAVFYPGSYTVTYESALYTASSQTVAVTAPAGEPLPLAVELTPSETAATSVQQQVKTYLDTCATKNSLYPAGCPFEYDFSGRVDGDVTWLVTEYPQAQVTLAGGKWALGKSSGEAEISFTELDLYTGKTQQVTETVMFTLAGSLTADGEALTFTPDS
ncbi:MAG: hypothetical protein SPI83_02660 [Rothia sp. (in: high G+C Gram-positive bacteria)]|nr:hypothetical protein [Rothia sp. (in: high G+C Gram-positive bacteria)]